MKNDTDFWERLKELLKTKNITAKKMCEDLKISYNTYRNQVTKKIKPDFDEIISFSNYLQVSCDYLLTGKVDLMPHGDLTIEQVKDAFNTALEMVISSTRKE